LFNDCKGSFRTPGSFVSVGKHPYQRIRVADLNGDGTADIIIPNLEGNNVSVLLGEGKGTFVQPTGSPFPLDRFPNIVAMGDVDGDGSVDVVVSNPDGGHITILAMTRNGRVASRKHLSVREHPKGLAIRDVDGDGKGDIAVTNISENTVTVIFGR
jgi:hypothetical protein